VQQIRAIKRQRAMDRDDHGPDVVADRSQPLGVEGSSGSFDGMANGATQARRCEGLSEGLFNGRFIECFTVMVDRIMAGWFRSPPLV